MVPTRRRASISSDQNASLYRGEQQGPTDAWELTRNVDVDGGVIIEQPHERIPEVGHDESNTSVGDDE